MTKPMTAADLTAALKELDDYLAHIGGCGDGNCIIVKPAGMHTNGGCHCPRDHIAMQRYAYAHNKFASAIRAISVDAAAMTHREARMLADRKLGKLALVLELDPAELACRIYEGMAHVRRPDGLTAAQALASLRDADREVHDNLLTTAQRVAEYMTECFRNAQRPS
ncbi:MAG: hypothetical protein JSS66_18890 [Armatimonadetes bacterium]|nr:hypothetical protein [Armatimonadota bacterium]